MKNEKTPDANEKNIFRPRNLIPGTLIYKGRVKQGYSIDIHYYNKHDSKTLSFESTSAFIDFDINFKERNEYIKWINITGLWNIDGIKKAGAHLNISDLLLEEILNISTHSINRAGKDYLFNCIQMVYTNNREINNEYISIYKSSDVLVTFQEKPGDIFDDIRSRIRNNEGLVRQKTLDYLYFCLMDALGDNYLAVTESLQPNIEEVEEKVIRGDRMKIQVIHELRKILMILEFSTEPVGRFIQMLLEDDTLLPKTDRNFLESLDTHIKQAISEIKLQNDNVDHLFENYVLNNSNNMNQVMTILTIFSAIFIPLSFLAGVFGMNFNYLPGLENKMGFFYFLIGCGVTAGCMLVIFKIKKWF